MEENHVKVAYKDETKIIDQAETYNEFRNQLANRLGFNLNGNFIICYKNNATGEVEMIKNEEDYKNMVDFCEDPEIMIKEGDETRSIARTGDINFNGIADNYVNMNGEEIKIETNVNGHPEEKKSEIIYDNIVSEFIA